MTSYWIIRDRQLVDGLVVSYFSNFWTSQVSIMILFRTSINSDKSEALLYVEVCSCVKHKWQMWRCNIQYLHYLLVEEDIRFTILDSLRWDLGDILVIKLIPLLWYTVQRVTGVVATTSCPMMTDYRHQIIACNLWNTICNITDNN